MSEQVYSITQLAREFALTPRAIRHYEDLGLVNPRREGANRVFSARDRARLKLVQQSSRLGFPLAEIKLLFELHDRCHGDGRHSGEFLAKLQTWRETLERQRLEIDALLEEIRFFDSHYRK